MYFNINGKVTANGSESINLNGEGSGGRIHLYNYCWDKKSNQNEMALQNNGNDILQPQYIFKSGAFMAEKGYRPNYDQIKGLEKF